MCRHIGSFPFLTPGTLDVHKFLAFVYAGFRGDSDKDYTTSLQDFFDPGNPYDGLLCWGFLIEVRWSHA